MTAALALWSAGSSCATRSTRSPSRRPSSRSSSGRCARAARSDGGEHDVLDLVGRGVEDLERPVDRRLCGDVGERRRRGAYGVASRRRRERGRDLQRLVERQPIDVEHVREVRVQQGEVVGQVVERLTRAVVGAGEQVAPGSERLVQPTGSTEPVRQAGQVAVAVGALGLRVGDRRSGGRRVVVDQQPEGLAGGHGRAGPPACDQRLDPPPLTAEEPERRALLGAGDLEGRDGVLGTHRLGPAGGRTSRRGGRLVGLALASRSSSQLGRRGRPPGEHAQRTVAGERVEQRVQVGDLADLRDGERSGLGSARRGEQREHAAH